MLKFEFGIICVKRMLETRFVGLTPSDEPFKYISGLKSALINKQMIRVQSFHVHVHVVYLNDTQKLQVPIIYVVIEAIISANLKETVKITFVNNPECLVGFPFKT